MSKFKCQNSKHKINLNVKGQIPKLKFCHLLFGICHYFVIYALSFVILMSGCATMKEMTSGIAGASTKVLEDGRKNAIIRKFNCDYNACYNKVEGILKHIGAYIYAKDIKKQMIAIYVSETDTTPVGLFFKVIDTNNTQIELSSPSTYAKEFIAQGVFLALEKSLKP